MRLHITFGLRYRNEPHPTFPLADPDGWVTIVAPSHEEARVIAFSAIGDAWAFDYPEDRFAKYQHHYPKGELAVLTREDTHCVCGHIRAAHSSFTGQNKMVGAGLGYCFEPDAPGCGCMAFMLAERAPERGTV